ncbi:MAG: type 4a pilus biogenesis protein PilO [Candidatus Omnitrophica bacterium]|nr:type 4a pilus biogenesis protein PilO [Candidatus Omnitrophota bacterium]
MNEITKFIAGLNDNQKKLFTIALVIVVAALFDRLLIAPTMSRLTSIDEDITKEEASIKQDIRFLGYKDRISKESREIDPYLTKIVSTDEEMIAAFLKKIENLANQSKVTLIKVNPASGEQTAQYWKYQADLECSGQLGDVISFIHSVNTATDLLKVVKFNFTSKKSDTDEIKAAMTIEKIVVPSKGMPVKAQDANNDHPNVPQTNPPASP